MKKEWVASELTMEVVVGAFMVMVLLGMGYFTIILSKENIFTRDKHRLEVVFKNIMGLSKGDRVVVRGMAIGKVKKFDLQQDGVHVHAILEEPVSLNKDYTISVVTASILGGRYLEINEGIDKEHPIPEGIILKGQDPFDLVADAAVMINSLKKGLTEGGVIDNLKETMTSIKEIANRLNTGKGTLGKLLSEDDKLYRDLEDTVASLKAVTGRLEKGEGTLGKLLS
ncbi:MAG: MlaD family protein, partial [Kiritimatiellae bacterium]|nr:MlaD family protein [Kiritimatiellia bacterium]